jgi:hypothetical protein
MSTEKDLSLGTKILINLIAFALIGVGLWYILTQ